MMKTSIVSLILALISPLTSFAADDNKLVVHEWGTFTSVFGSDGKVLPGLEIDEERLPQFVYAHDMERGFPQFQVEGAKKPEPGRVFMKGMWRPLHNVTVKMETPVLYFYTDEAVDAEVKIGFEGGSISQWYPGRSGGEIPPPIIMNKDRTFKSGPIDFAKSYQGSIKWNVRVEPRGEHTDFEVMKPGETANWLHPRAPKSDLLRTASGETESYLFYRGLGNFDQPIAFSVENQQLLARSTTEIPYLLVLDWNNEGARIAYSGKPDLTESIALGADGGPRKPMPELQQRNLWRSPHRSRRRRPLLR
ncbi:MAG: hypothetical protein ACI8UO_001862 [Verrucomicrobiales bacterium]|jgi:hypothetical protein